MIAFQAIEHRVEGARPAALCLRHRVSPSIRGDRRGYQAGLYRFVRRLLGAALNAPTDEVFQDTWLRVVHARARWAPQGASFRTWLFTLAHHRVVDLLRRSGREVSTGAFEGDGGEPWEPGAAAVGRIDQHRAGHGGNARGRDRAAQRADRPGRSPSRGRAGGRRSEGGSGPAGSAAARRHHCGALAATLRLGDAMVRRAPGWQATLSPAAVATLKQALDGTAP